MACKNCGEVLSQTPGKRQRVFCDSTCRSSYWQKENRRKEKAISEAFEVQGAPVGKGLIERIFEGATIGWPGKVLPAEQEAGPSPAPLGAHARSFRDYLDLVKSGKFDKAKLEAEVRSAPGLTSGQRDMVIAKIRNA